MARVPQAASDVALQGDEVVTQPHELVQMGEDVGHGPPEVRQLIDDEVHELTVLVRLDKVLMTPARTVFAALRSAFSSTLTCTHVEADASLRRLVSSRMSQLWGCR